MRVIEAVVDEILFCPSAPGVVSLESQEGPFPFGEHDFIFHEPTDRDQSLDS